MEWNTLEDAHYVSLVLPQLALVCPQYWVFSDEHPSSSLSAFMPKAIFYFLVFLDAGGAKVVATASKTVECIEITEAAPSLRLESTCVLEILEMVVMVLRHVNAQY
ncbi:hypothetical protein E2C01_030941 [Portunus trituberculatus]|uniref:Uncharacterized protein n=1 Tax=Portunus trituberculatus TaxID=210409 RepID=A0A5B7ESC6_PORTR|nr:hypothetical protein [Portunus trituberculatus]